MGKRSAQHHSLSDGRVRTSRQALSNVTTPTAPNSGYSDKTLVLGFMKLLNNCIGEAKILLENIFSFFFLLKFQVSLRGAVSA